MKSVWPVGLVLFFIVFISGVVSLVVWSTRQREDLVAPDYYEMEIRFQDRIDAAERTRQESAAPRVSYDAAQQALSVRFPVTDANGSITLYRPSDARLDQTHAIETDADGVQTIAGPLARGLWRIRTEWQRQQRAYFAETAVFVP